MNLRRDPRYASSLVCVAVLLAVSPGRGEKLPNKARNACMASYESAQEARKGQRLQAAKEKLVVCAQPTCGKVIRNDCMKWLDEVVVEMQAAASAKAAVET